MLDTDQQAEQQELFTGRYLKLIEDHQTLQTAHAKVWAENERRKLEMEELQTALLIMMKRHGVPEVLLHPTETRDMRFYVLRREAVNQSVLYRRERRG